VWIRGQAPEGGHHVHLILIGSVVVLAIAAGACSSDESGFPAAGGAGGGGASTGGTSTGGVSTGGTSTGGVSTGGTSTGGMSTGGISGGGAISGGTSGGVAISGGTSGGGAISGGTGGGVGGSANGGTSGTAAVSYAKDVQPILMARCAPCHAGEGQGHHDIATTYADAKLPVESLQFDECWADFTTATGPKTIGECSMLLARAGKMPISKGCDRPTPPNPSLCTTPAENDILAAWVASGLAP
jgi:hypothetical protein